MPKHSGATFSVQPVETNGDISGFVVSGFFNQSQLEALRDLIDTAEYERSKRWRYQYQEMAKAIVTAINDTIG